MNTESAAILGGVSARPERLSGDLVFDAQCRVSEPSAACVHEPTVPVPTMLVQRELNYLKWLASKTDGSGRVVDLGCFLGGSTAALVAGLAEGGDTTGDILAYDAFETVSHERSRYTSWLEPFGITPGTSLRERFDRFNRDWLDRLVVREGWLPGDASPAQELAVYPEQEPIGLLFVDLAKTWDVHLTALRAFARHLRPGSMLVQQDFFDLQTPWIPLHMWQLRDVLRPLDAIHGTPTLGLECIGDMSSAIGSLWRADEVHNRESRTAAWDGVGAYWAEILGDEAAGFFAGHASVHALLAGDPDDAARWGRRYEAWSRSEASNGYYFAPAWPELMESVAGELAAEGTPSEAMAVLAAESVSRGSRLERLRDGERTSYCPLRQRRQIWERVAERLSAAGHTRVALFGAGQHTRWLLGASILADSGIEVVTVVDDSPKESTLGGAPVVGSAGFSPSGAGVSAVLPSSDTFEDQLLTRIYELYADEGIAIERAYTDLGDSGVARQAKREYTVEVPEVASAAPLESTGVPCEGSARHAFGLPAERTWAGALADRIRIPSWCIGHISAHEIAFLWDAIEAVRPERIVEIGTASGVSTALLIAAVEEFCGPDATLFSFDVATHCYFDENRPLAAAVGEMVPNLLSRARLFARANAVDAASCFGIGTIDLAFIDGNHGHPAPALDLLALLYAMRPGAWVALHDIELGNFTVERDGSAWDGCTGPGRLYEAWPFEKIQPHAAIPSERNIGAIRMPENPVDALPTLLALLDGEHEADGPEMEAARRAAQIFKEGQG